jgi:hypothetical protein
MRANRLLLAATGALVSASSLCACLDRPPYRTRPETLIRDDALQDVVKLFVDGPNLYWFSRREQSVEVARAPKDGSGPVQVIGSSFDREVIDATQDATYLYWTAKTGTSASVSASMYDVVARLRKDGSQPVEILATKETDGIVCGIAVAERYVYWIERPVGESSTPDATCTYGCLRRAAKDGSSLKTVYSNPSNGQVDGSGGMYLGLCYLAVDDRSIYWAGLGPQGDDQKLIVWRMSQEDGSSEEILMGEAGYAAGQSTSVGNWEFSNITAPRLRVNGDGIYWSALSYCSHCSSPSTYGSTSDIFDAFKAVIRKTPLGGGASVAIVAETFIVRELAVVADDLFWLTLETEAVTSGSGDSADAVLQRIGLSGGESERISPEWEIHGFAVDADYVYWPSDDGAIYRLRH